MDVSSATPRSPKSTKDAGSSAPRHRAGASIRPVEHRPRKSAVPVEQHDGPRRRSACTGSARQRRPAGGRQGPPIAPPDFTEQGRLSFDRPRNVEGEGWRSRWLESHLRANFARKRRAALQGGLSRRGGGHRSWHRLRLWGLDPNLLGFRRRLNRFWRLVFSGCRLRLLDGFLVLVQGGSSSVANRRGGTSSLRSLAHVQTSVFDNNPSPSASMEVISRSRTQASGVAGGSLDDIRQVARFNESTACSKYFVDGLHRHVLLEIQFTKPSSMEGKRSMMLLTPFARRAWPLVDERG